MQICNMYDETLTTPACSCDFLFGERNLHHQIGIALARRGAETLTAAEESAWIEAGSASGPVHDVPTSPRQNINPSGGAFCQHVVPTVWPVRHILKQTDRARAKGRKSLRRGDRFVSGITFGRDFCVSDIRNGGAHGKQYGGYFRKIGTVYEKRYAGRYCRQGGE
jgi:hypothetical protein